MNQTRKKRKIQLLFLLYAISFFGWMFYAGMQTVQARKLEPVELDQSLFLTEGLTRRTEPYGDYQNPWASVAPDTQMLYPELVTMNGLSFYMRGHRSTGTPILYYRYQGKGPYQMVFPTEYHPESGLFVFDTGVLRQVEFRLDPITTAGCLFELRELQLNLCTPLWRSWVPNCSQAVLILFVPLFLFLTADILCDVRKKDIKQEK